MTDGRPTELAGVLRERSGNAMALNDAYLNPQLGRIVRTLGFDRTWVRGEGLDLIDDTGARYLDLLCGYGVFAVGRSHPRVIAALTDVLNAATPNLPQMGVSLLPGLLAQRLVELAPSSVDAVVFANSGAEAVEAAIKLARATTGRPRILFAEHGFHGLTLGALSLNGNDEFRDGFGPLLPGCESVPFGDLEALQQELAAGDVAAFVVEPVQGKGVNLPPDGYLAAAQTACRAAGTLLCCDEVQTGLGRTGRFFALEHWGLEPDLITVAKALSGGYVPTGAVLCSRAVMDAVFDGMERGVRHGSTFGNNDLAATAGLATLDVLRRRGPRPPRGTPGRPAARAHDTAHRPLRHRARRPRPRSDVGDRARPAPGRRGAAGLGSGRARPAGTCRAIADRAAVPRAPDPVPGRGSPYERGQGAAGTGRRRGRHPSLCRRARQRHRVGTAPPPRLRTAGRRHGAAVDAPASRADAHVKALVTGAGGFIGAHVAQALLDANHDVRAFDRATAFVPEGAEPVAGDILDAGAVERAIDGCDAVFHLAAVYSYARGDAGAMQAVNVDGTRNVLDIAARRGVPVVHTSSCATCGPVRGRAATEDDAPPAYELAVAYKRTKLDGERLALRAAAEGIAS